jgi:hypothetical protein
MIVGPALAEVCQMLAEGDRLISGNQRGSQNSRGPVNALLTGLWIFRNDL